MSAGEILPGGERLIDGFSVMRLHLVESISPAKRRERLLAESKWRELDPDEKLLLDELLKPMPEQPMPPVSERPQ